VDVARLRAVVAPVVAGAGYDLEDLTVHRMGRRHLLRLAVDSDQGVDLDRVADLSRGISAALDAAEAAEGDLVPGEYELEVGSPGVDRPLTAPRHWRRNRGRLVQVRAAGRQLTGRVTDADDAGVVLDVDGAARRFAYPELGPGRVQVEFTRRGHGPADGHADDMDDFDEFDDLDDLDGVGGIADEGEDEQ
jgi:ribosome maturation factor RimP